MDAGRLLRILLNCKVEGHRDIGRLKTRWKYGLIRQWECYIYLYQSEWMGNNIPLPPPRARVRQAYVYASDYS